MGRVLPAVGDRWRFGDGGCVKKPDLLLLERVFQKSESAQGEATYER